jgi:hypothetical protein
VCGGFTLVALGTSVPELVTTIAAQRRGESDLVIGNLFGSNLFNSLAGGAIVGLATGRHPAAPANVAVLVAMVLTAVTAWALLRRGLNRTRVERRPVADLRRRAAARSHGVTKDPSVTASFCRNSLICAAMAGPVRPDPDHVAVA